MNGPRVRLAFFVGDKLSRPLKKRTTAVWRYDGELDSGTVLPGIRKGIVNDCRNRGGHEQHRASFEIPQNAGGKAWKTSHTTEFSRPAGFSGFASSELTNF